MTLQSDAQAYGEGVIAYSDDVPRVDNPYEGKDGMESAARQWFAGYDQAQEDDPLNYTDDEDGADSDGDED